MAKHNRIEHPQFYKEASPKKSLENNKDLTSSVLSMQFQI